MKDINRITIILIVLWVAMILIYVAIGFSLRGEEMSLGSDYMADYEYEKDQAIYKLEYLEIKAMKDASRGIWYDKEGKMHNVNEMETSYIENCIRMLERNKSPFLKYYGPMFEKELDKRIINWG